MQQFVHVADRSVSQRFDMRTMRTAVSVITIGLFDALPPALVRMRKPD
jgi:hypothetical protein